tara:strand:+ start:350 stop:502 length:153 start_codon:yes stop_codon:yes gene_type:complete
MNREQTILHHKIAVTECAEIRAKNPEFKELWTRNMNELKRKLKRLEQVKK